MDLPLTGSCQCGGVTYEIRGAPLALYACHCTNCQRQSSSAYGMSMSIRDKDFRLTGGQVKERGQVADSGRSKILAFCPECGSRIHHRPQTGTGMNIKPGTLDDTSWLTPIAHIWTSRKQPGVVIPDGTLTYETEPDDFAAIFEAWQARQTPD